MHERPELAPGISLRQVLPEAEFFGAEDIRVTGCTSDSRSCRPGDLFVALRGRGQDGHAFVAEAAARGASAILAEQPIADCRLPICYVVDSREAFGRVCQVLAGDPSQRLKVVGVTGTNGKTTTVHLICGILLAAGHRVGRLGTLGYFDGQDFALASHTTPAAPMLATWLARMETNGCTHAVIEVSSHALEQSRIAGVTLDVACVTNIRQDHLDYHQTIPQYHQAKARIFSHLAPQGVTVLNADDPGSNSLLNRLDGPVLTVGIESPAEVTATPVEQFLSEQTFLLSVGAETVPVRTHVIGLHNITNCLVAAAAGLAYGIDLPTIVRGLESVQGIPGRLERIECGQPFGVFVDFAHTPDALATALDALRSATRGRLICVFGAGGDRDKQKRPAMGRAVESWADLTIVTSDNPRTEPPDAIVREILKGFHSPQRARIIPDRAAAIAWALSQADEGDCVLIAGRGHETHQIIGNEKIPLDDREAARQWLRSRWVPTRQRAGV